MHPLHEHRLHLTRRELFGRSAVGIGTAALATLLGEDLGAVPAQPAAAGALPGFPHFAPKAKRVICLMQGGAPSQVDLFDYQPGGASKRAAGIVSTVANPASLLTGCCLAYPL